MTLRQKAMASAGAAVALISGPEKEMPPIETASSSRSRVGSGCAGRGSAAVGAGAVAGRAVGTALLRWSRWWADLTVRPVAPGWNCRPEDETSGGREGTGGRETRTLSDMDRTPAAVTADDFLDQALLEEAAKKSGLLWVRADGPEQARPRVHGWHDGAGGVE